MQETRVRKNNIRHAPKRVESTGKALFPGQLLPGIVQKNGKHRVAHGGTAILAATQTATPFDPCSDITGLYAELFKANRCNALWLQVTRRIKALIFSVYCQTGASSDHAIHEANNDILEKLFLINSQFGDIPIIIAGDVQDHPLHYESVSRAIHFRALTYSLDGLFWTWRKLLLD